MIAVPGRIPKGSRVNLNRHPGGLGAVVVGPGALAPGEGQQVLQLRPVEPGGNEAAGDAGDQALQQNAAGARIEIGIGRTGRDDKAGEREDRQSQRRKHARHLKRMESRGWPRSASRSEEHTSELQSLMRISYSGVCLKKKKN